MTPLPTTPCGRCGAPLPVDPLRAAVACQHCHEVWPVPDDLRARAAAHLESLRPLWADALEARAAELAHHHAAAVTPTFNRWLVPFVLSVPFAVVAQGVLFERLPLAISVSIVAAVGLVWWRFTSAFVALFRPPSIGAVLVSGLGACRGCGAPVHIPEDQVATSCRHCGSTVLATPEVKRELTAAAFARARALASARDQAIAKNWRAASDGRAAYGVPGKVSTIAVVLVMIGAVAITSLVVVSALLWGDEAARTPTAWVCPAWGIAALATVVRFVTAVARLRRGARELEAAMGRKLRRQPIAPPPTAP